MTEATPAVAMSARGMAACSCVLLMKVAAMFVAFQPTVAPLTKFDPFTVRTNPPPPAIALEGDMEASTGAAPLAVKVAVTAVGLLFTVTVQGVLEVGVQPLQLVKVEPAAA